MKQTRYLIGVKAIALSLTFLGVTQSARPFASQASSLSSASLLINAQAERENKELLLYGGYRTRSPIVQWYLEELAIPYQYIALDIQAQEQRQPKFLSVNPMGKVPAIVDGDFKLWESGAILLYLADKYGQMSNSLEDRAIRMQWVIFANATLGPGLFLEDRRNREMPRLLTPLNNILQKQPFLIESKFSEADVAVGSYLYYAKILLSLDFSDYPAVESYLSRLSARPAFQNTLGKR